MRQLRVGDWTWENDSELQEFKRLMMDYELARASLLENMLPYYDCYGDLRVPQIEEQLLANQQRVAKNTARQRNATPVELIGLQQEAAILAQEEAEFPNQRMAALAKWNEFEALVKQIVECEYQKRHYTPIVQDTTEFGVRLHFTNNPFPTIVTSSPLRVAQCTLKQALLNGPFTSLSQ
jgi:hypothetical protein